MDICLLFSNVLKLVSTYFELYETPPYPPTYILPSSFKIDLEVAWFLGFYGFWHFFLGFYEFCHF